MVWAALRLGEAAARPFRRPWRGPTAEADPAAAARWLQRVVAEAAQRQLAIPAAVRSQTLALCAECTAQANDQATAMAIVSDLRRHIKAQMDRNRRLREQLLADVRRLARRVRKVR